MGYEKGLIKYVAKGPFSNPVAFFVYGSFFLSVYNATVSLDNGSLVDAFIAYYSTKYLPPTTLWDVLIPILLGSTVAGIKWYINTPKR